MGSGCVAAWSRLAPGVLRRRWVLFGDMQLFSTGLCRGARSVGHEYEDTSRKGAHDSYKDTRLWQGASKEGLVAARLTSPGHPHACMNCLARQGCLALLFEASPALAQGTRKSAGRASKDQADATHRTRYFACSRCSKGSMVFKDEEEWRGQW